MCSENACVSVFNIIVIKVVKVQTDCYIIIGLVTFHLSLPACISLGAFTEHYVYSYTHLNQVLLEHFVINSADVAVECPHPIKL